MPAANRNLQGYLLVDYSRCKNLARKGFSELRVPGVPESTNCIRIESLTSSTRLCSASYIAARGW